MQDTLNFGSPALWLDFSMSDACNTNTSLSKPGAFVGYLTSLAINSFVDDEILRPPREISIPDSS